MPSQTHTQALEGPEFYRLLVESVQDYAIFMLDTEGNIASWNIGAQKLKGYTQDEIVGRHFSIFYTEEDILKEKPRKELEECIAIGRTEDEYWRVRKDGTKFWANVVITALRSKKGTLIGYAKVTRDLTERKRHEDALRRANQQLKSQQAELEVLNSAKDEFIAIASHQLRTPATGVKQYLGLIKDGYFGDLSRQQEKIITKAYETNDRQIELVNSLLRVAQIDAGKMVLSLERTELVKVVGSIVDEMTGNFKKRHQEVSIAAPHGAVYVRVDPVRFRMVLENLIDNASKYTPDGGSVTITVNADVSSTNIEITDTGVGIDQLSIAKLFTKFSRLQNEMSDSVSGSGLGLYWVKKIIELHGGEVHVTSKEGVGSKFTITLPKEGTV